MLFFSLFTFSFYIRIAFYFLRIFAIFFNVLFVVVFLWYLYDATFSLVVHCTLYKYALLGIQNVMQTENASSTTEINNHSVKTVWISKKTYQMPEKDLLHAKRFSRLLEYSVRWSTWWNEFQLTEEKQYICGINQSSIRKKCSIYHWNPHFSDISFRTSDGKLIKYFRQNCQQLNLSKRYHILKSAARVALRTHFKWILFNYKY